MTKEIWINYKGKWVKNPSKWILFKRAFKDYLRRWKIVDTWKYRIIPHSEMDRHFILSSIEKNEADEIYKEKGTLEYHFFPCSGIGWGVRVKVVKTDEIIDITDITNW